VNSVWLDTNVLVRFITSDSSEQAGRVVALMRRAERGEVNLRLATIVVAEAVWVLGSVYAFDRGQIAEALRAFILADGVSAEDREIVTDALRFMQDQNVAYVDAYLAALARDRHEPIASFDTGFRRLGVEMYAMSGAHA
jgi:predicted nucleic acid-binding protein